jgi:hypothetical protein
MAAFSRQRQQNCHNFFFIFCSILKAQSNNGNNELTTVLSYAKRMKMNGARLTWRKIVRGIFSSAVVVYNGRDFSLSENRCDLLCCLLMETRTDLSSYLRIYRAHWAQTQLPMALVKQFEVGDQLEEHYPQGSHILATTSSRLLCRRVVIIACHRSAIGPQQQSGYSR